MHRDDLSLTNLYQVVDDAEGDHKNDENRSLQRNQEQSRDRRIEVLGYELNTQPQ